jgi:hypothetical protein
MDMPEAPAIIDPADKIKPQCCCKGADFAAGKRQGRMWLNPV